MDKNCGIYCIINQVNGKMYIGQSIQIDKRWNRHLTELRHNKHGKHLQSAFNKYGEESFKWKVLKYCKEEDLTKWEKFYINKYQSFNPNCGYNKTSGGEGVTMTDEVKEKIRIKAMGNKRNLGKKRSPETIEKIRQANIGQKRTEESKKKMSEKAKGKPKPKGRKLSPDHIEKLKLFKKGQIPWIKNRKHTEESKEKMRQSHLGKKMSEEQKKKISEREKGKITSEETKTKMRETWKKKRLEKSIKIKGEV